MTTKINTKLAKAGKSIGGAAAFVRSAIASGKPVAEVRKATLAKFPRFATDKAGLTSRINMARKLVAHGKNAQN